MKERRTYESVITQTVAESTYMTLGFVKEIMQPIADVAKHAVIFRRRKNG